MPSAVRESDQAEGRSPWQNAAVSWTCFCFRAYAERVEHLL